MSQTKVKSRMYASKLLTERSPVVKRRVVSSDPLVCLTEHPRADGSAVVIAINYSDKPKTCALEIGGRVGAVHHGEIEETMLRIAPNDAAVFEVAGGK